MGWRVTIGIQHVLRAYFLLIFQFLAKIAPSLPSLGNLVPE